MTQAAKAARPQRTAQAAMAAGQVAAADADGNATQAAEAAQAVIAELMPAPAKAPAAPGGRHQLSERFADPDLVDRIFEYLCENVPALQQDPQRVAELKQATRQEFRGQEVYIPLRGRTERQELVAQALAMFNGRNAHEVARRLNIHVASVYRWVKQSPPMR